MRDHDDDIHLSPEGIEGAVPEALSGPAPIDADNPGFLSLLTVIEAALDDSVDMAVMVTYHNELAERLEVTREVLDRTPIPASILEEAAPTLTATREALAGLEEVVALFGDYLGSGKIDYLKRARKLLVQVLGQVQPPASGE